MTQPDHPAMTARLPHYAYYQLLLLVIWCCHGCASRFWLAGERNGRHGPVKVAATTIDYPEGQECVALDAPPALASPHSVRSEPPTDFYDLTLEEALLVGLKNSKVLRDLGGSVLASPETATTVFDPAIRESDPRFGVEGALSAFDTQLATSLFWQQNDRVFNNVVEGGGAREFEQDLATFQTELSKVAATGTRFSLRNLTRYDENNSPLRINDQPNRLFLNSWDSQFEASIRQPLLQGAGVAFNRIVGPNAQPGLNSTTGVVLARINTDVSLADFEAGVRNVVSDLEDAYWELYFAYRALDAVVLARDSALETWQKVKTRYDKNLIGGEAFKEARARAQYFQFQNQVQNALNGAVTGSRSVGIYAGDRRLRWLMGLPTNDVRVIRPIDEPGTAEVLFNWHATLGEALVRRVELRKQMWQVKRRELEAMVAGNFARPRLDAVVEYRLRGFGDDLTGSSLPRFSSAFQDMGTWDHQEWQAGLQLNMPLGLRQGWAAVRQAELQLSRERAILAEQKKRVSLELSNAMAEASRAHSSVRLSFNQLAAAREDTDATRAAYDNEQISVELLLESQQRRAVVENQYYRSLADYAIALKNVHFQKGSLLQYNDVLLREGPWPMAAYADAAELAERWIPKEIDYWIAKPAVISKGRYAQQQEYAGADSLEFESDSGLDSTAVDTQIELDPATIQLAPEVDLSEPSLPEPFPVEEFR